MILTDRTIVVDDDRPNVVRWGGVVCKSAETHCRYCRAGVGTPHRFDCPIPRKTVLLKVHANLIVDVPQNWTDEDVEFHFNESSSCTDNVLNNLTRQTARLGATQGCSCGSVQVEYSREATESDHRELAWGVTIPVSSLDDQVTGLS